MTYFSTHLQKHRVKAGLSLRALARELGISHVSLRKLEQGEIPRLGPKHWGKLAETFDLEIETVAFWSFRDLLAKHNAEMSIARNKEVSP